jgi:hypothetical protein
MSICWYKPCYGAFAILADKNPTATDYPVGMCISPHGSSVVAETPNDMLVLTGIMETKLNLFYFYYYYAVIY